MMQLLFRDAYYSAINELPKDERLQLYESVMKFAFNGEEIDKNNLSTAARPLYVFILSSIKSDREKYSRRKEEIKEHKPQKAVR